MSSADDRQYAPAATRNRGPILNVLRSILPRSGSVLEVASGTGEHVVHFARAFPMLTWQPSDPAKEARRSISAWIATVDWRMSALLSISMQPATVEQNARDPELRRVQSLVAQTISITRAKYPDDSVKTSKEVEARRQEVASRIGASDRIAAIQIRNQQAQRVREITQDQGLSREGRTR